MLAALLAAGCFQVIYGGPRFRTGDPVIWGVTITDPTGRLHGTFVNPNHTAFFLALVVPIALAWFWLAFRYGQEGGSQGARILWISAPVLILLLLFGGVLLTQSRAGLGAVSVVLILLSGLMFKGRRRSTILIGASALGVLLTTVVLRSGEGVVRRLWELQIGADAGSSRFDVYRQVVELWGRFPILGSGLGTFRSAFSARSDASLRGQWWNAHSDWLELAATGGVVALLLVGFGLTRVAVVLWRRRGRYSRQDRAVNFAVLGALVAAALHSLVDFGLAMPANQFALALLVGIGMSPDRHGKRSRAADDPGEVSPSSPPRAA